jgi:catechol 2,3-dioxygenase
MTLEPLDLHALIQEARAPEEHASGTDIGHVHLEASDLAQTVDFYVNALGLDLMAEYGDQAGFFSSRGYHHHLGANTWHSLGRKPAPKNHAGLERIVFGVETAAELDAARRRLEGYGHQVTLAGNELVVHDPDGIELHFVAG